MKGSNCEESFKNKKLGKVCRVEVTNCLKAYNDFQKIKSCRIDLTNCSHQKVKWYRKKIGGILPEIRLPKIVLRNINKKQKLENEPWTLAGFLGDPYLNAEYFRLLLQTPTSRKINKKLVRENEPWVLEGFLGDSYLNSEHFRLLLQSPTKRNL